MPQDEKLFHRVHSRFTASISEAYDCGRMCAPLNGGEPVCCSTAHAIPIVDKAEWRYLRGKTDLWRKFKATDRASRQVVEECASTCMAVECKGAAHCEREHRTLACRAFPFFPYFNRERELLGLSYYWTFEDRCWVMSNLRIVERPFIQQFLASYRLVFQQDEDELEEFIHHSAAMRRVFTRWKRPIPILDEQGSLHKILPGDPTLRRASWKDFPPHRVFASDRNYRREIRESGHDPGNATLTPDWSIREWWKAG